ncbi:hypothetical protein PROFUN_16227, partial [Planoprotostelium fungivorum]
VHASSSAKTRAVVAKEACSPSIVQKPSKIPSIASQPSRTDDSSTSQEVHVNTDTVLRSASVAPIASAGRRGWDHPSFHLNTNTPANTGPFSNTRGALRRAAANNRTATTINRQVEPHLNNRDFISAPSQLEVPLHERNKKVPLLRRAQTSAEIQRATISENGGSDTQNRVSAGNLSHLQLRFLSTTTRKPFKSPVKRTQTIHKILGLQLAQPAQDEQLSSHKKTLHLKRILFGRYVAIAGNSREAQTGTSTSYEESVIVSAGERICSSDKEVPASILIDLQHHSPAQEPTRNIESTRHQLFGHLHSVVKHLLPTQKRKSLTSEEENRLHDKGSAQDSDDTEVMPSEERETTATLHGVSVNHGQFHSPLEDEEVASWTEDQSTPPPKRTETWIDLSHKHLEEVIQRHPSHSPLAPDDGKELTQTQDNDELSATPTNTDSSGCSVRVLLADCQSASSPIAARYLLTFERGSNTPNKDGWLRVGSFHDRCGDFEFNHANDPMKIPQRQFLANNTPTDRDRLINRLRWPSISTVRVVEVSDFRRNLKEHVTRSSRIHGSTEFVAEGLDCQDSIIETKGRDRQSLNKTRTPHHWGQDKGERSITGTKTKRQELEWVKMKNSLIWIQHSLED